MDARLPSSLTGTTGLWCSTIPFILLSISTGKLQYYKKKKKSTTRKYITETPYSSIAGNGFPFPEHQVKPT